MVFFSIVIYTLFGGMCIWFIISGIQKIKQIQASQALSEFYTNEEEHDKAIQDAQSYEEGYFERIRQGEQSQQFLAVGSFFICSFIRSLLAAENIPTYTENEHINTMYSLNALNGNSSFSIKVFILIADYERAYEIISDFIKKHERANEDESSGHSAVKTAVKAVSSGLFFVNLGEGPEEAVHGIMILPRVTGN
ncbi:MAG: DUF2007 domain-containing protein [Treponema sp.]|nr:DUF2007 domain-containing protein [Treponema sp.]